MYLFCDGNDDNDDDDSDDDGGQQTAENLVPCCDSEWFNDAKLIRYGKNCDVINYISLFPLNCLTVSKITR